MKRVIVPLYSVASYLLFLALFIYFVGFTENLVVARTVDAGGAVRTPAMAYGVDIGWFILFGVQHSVMARPAFKARWTRVVPLVAERSTYVLVTTLLVLLLVWQWTPIPTVLWNVESPILKHGLVALSFAGWGLLLYATFLFDHFEFFGVRHVYDTARGRISTAMSFKTPSLYRYIRHPMYLGFLIAFWSTPKMTIGHLLLAVGMTAYILVGVRFEERDLLARFGDDYRRYQARVGMLFPSIGDRR